MEYIFGTVWKDGEEVENLKTIGESHTDLKGFCYVERDYPDNKIVDTFYAIEKYQTDETDYNCLDWYYIKEHNRTIDRFTPHEEKINEGIADSQDALCILSEEFENRLTEIEDALCELTKEEE